MSWSISASGKPNEVAKKINEYGDTLTGESRCEFDGARHHIIGLVKQNWDERTVSLSASGHGIKNRECKVSMQ